MPTPATILSQLAYALSAAYQAPDLAAVLATTSDLDVARIALGPTMYTAWLAILAEAERQGRTEAPLQRARTDYPHRDPLTAAVTEYNAWAGAGRPASTTRAGDPAPADAPAGGSATTLGSTVIHTGRGAPIDTGRPAGDDPLVTPPRQ